MFWKKKKPDEDLAAKVADLESRLATIQNEIPMRDSQAFLEMIHGGNYGTIGVKSPEAAMRCSAVFACVRLISGAIASAPLLIYKQTDSGREVARHPLQRILSLRPNEHMTASTFWKVMAMQKVLNGNAYAAILRARPSGRAVGLVPFRAPRVTVYQAYELRLDEKYGVDPHRLYYSVMWDDGTPGMFDSDDMIHVPNINFDGKVGMSTVSAGAQAMGLAMAAEESAAKLFENGMVSQLALTYPQKLTADAQDKLREHLANRYQGAGNHHKPLILTEGGTAQTLALNAEDAQLLETRQFSVIDIARFFGVPPVMIGETEKTSSWGSGVEQMARWFVMFTLNDHLTDIEQEIAVKLFKSSEFRAEFDETELTRGDTKTRAEYFKAALGGTQSPGWMTQNDVRQAEGLPPMDGGNVLYVPKSEPSQGERNAEEQADATVEE